MANKSAAPVTLYPYALISRHGTPETLGYYILHEGLIGVLGDQGLQEETYKKIEEKKSITFKVTNAWLGITDKYWAATLIPDTKAQIQARFSAGTIGTLKTYQTDYLGDAQTIAPGASGATDTRLFAGAKEIAVVDGYDKQLNLNRFELLIDWGWFYFITKPMFWSIDFLFKWLGNFGLAILAVTVVIKIIFFPLANKSYASMAKMKAVQPQMQALRERYPRRQDEAATSADGSLQAGEDQPARRLPADPDPGPGVFRALQGAVRHDRDAARAVLRLDQGPLGAGSDQHLHAVRTDSNGIR